MWTCRPGNPGHRDRQSRGLAALFPAVLALCLLMTGALAVAQTVAQARVSSQAGAIVLAEGDARIAPGGAGARPARVGDTVSEGDLLITGGKGEIHLAMQDSGFMALRPNTRFEVVSYRASGAEDDTGVFRLLAGGLRSITGWIGRYNARAYLVRTPTATIGVRGTDHETRVIAQDSPEGEAGTYDRVYAGQTYVETDGGRAEVTPERAGFASSHPHRRPRLLDSIPVFYRPGPHEAEIANKHAEIQRLIDERREERRRLIREKLAALGQARAQVQTVQEKNKAQAEEALVQSQAKRQALKERGEALRQEVAVAREQREALQKQRALLQEDFKAGRLTHGELRDRRKALQLQAQSLERLEASHQARRKELQEALDALADDGFDKAQERQKTLRGQVLDAREKRKEVEAERESARDEVKTLQQQENARYREELKADRGARVPASSPPPRAP